MDYYITNCQNGVCCKLKEKWNTLYLFDWQRLLFKIRGYSIHYRVKVNKKIKKNITRFYRSVFGLSNVSERSWLNRTHHEHVSYRPQSYSATQPGDSWASEEQHGCTQTNPNSHKSVSISAKSKWRAHIHLFTLVYFLPHFQSRAEQPTSSAKILLTLVCDGRLLPEKAQLSLYFGPGNVTVSPSTWQIRPGRRSWRWNKRAKRWKRARMSQRNTQPWL